MNVRLRKKVHKIVDLCMDAKDLGHDCFFDYYPNVEQFGIRCYIGKFGREKPCSFTKEAYLDVEDAVEVLNETIEYLENLIEESL